MEGGLELKIIINADDFGYSDAVNSAIVEAFEKGFVTNTTVMVNMPGFEDSIALAKKHGFFDKVGLHLNFFEGQPLSEKIKSEPLFCVDNQLTNHNFFRKSNLLKRFFLSKRTRIALREEADAQIAKYKQAGFTQFHIDSHMHSHTIISVFLSIIESVKENDFKTMRKSLNLFPKRSCLVKIYKSICNKLITKNMPTIKYFTSASEFIQVMQSGFNDDQAVIEIMVHPVYQDNKLVNANNVDFETLFDYLKEASLLSYLEI